MSNSNKKFTVPQLNTIKRKLKDFDLTKTSVDGKFKLVDKLSGERIECSNTLINSFRRLMGITAANYTFNKEGGRNSTFTFNEHFERAQTKYGEEEFQIALLNNKAVNFLENKDSYLKSEQVQEFIDKVTDKNSDAIKEFSLDGRNNLNITFNNEIYAGNEFSVSGENFESILKMKIPLHATSTTMALYYIESIRLACLNGMIGTSDELTSSVKFHENNVVSRLTKSLEQKREPMPEEIEAMKNQFNFLRGANPHVALIYKVHQSLRSNQQLRPYAMELAEKFGLNRYESMKEAQGFPSIKGGMSMGKQNMVSAYEVYNFLTEISTHGVPNGLGSEFSQDAKNRLHLACKTILNQKNYLFRNVIEEREYSDFCVDYNPFDKASESNIINASSDSNSDDEL